MVLRLSSSLVAVCFLVCAGLALRCDWDKSTDPNQGLNTFSLERGAFLDQDWQVLDSDTCRNACCDVPECDLVLVDHQADGTTRCRLIRCLIGNRDVCVLQPDEHLKVYRKTGTGTAQVRAGPGGNRPRLSPMIGAGSRTPETRTSEENNVRCRLPMKVGPCRAAFPKFFYEPTNQSCRSFTYGGCQTNGNMFESQQECEDTCRGVTGSVFPDESTAAPSLSDQSPQLIPANDTSGGVKLDASQRTGSSADHHEESCGAEPQVGHCRAAFPRWYFNRRTGSCQSFIYGGCGGNDNNYLSKESCTAACAAFVLPSAQKRDNDENSSEFKDECAVTPDPGPCRAAFPKFFYDVSTSTCRSFIYGGCRGNKNRYSSEEECVTRCSALGRRNPRNRWTAAVFLFVTLASISVLLLVSLVVITLRRQRLTRQASITSDKEELLPDDSSSLESLSVPQGPGLVQA